MAVVAGVAVAAGLVGGGAYVYHSLPQSEAVAVAAAAAAPQPATVTVTGGEAASAAPANW